MDAMIVLVRNTTWKCGRIEKAIVSYLNERLGGRRRGVVKVKDILRHFKLQGKRRSEYIDAMKRLEKRRIIKIVYPT